MVVPHLRGPYNWDRENNTAEGIVTVKWWGQIEEGLVTGPDWATLKNVSLLGQMKRGQCVGQMGAT